MPATRLIQTIEYKNYDISGPMMDQVIGASLRAKYKNRPAVLTDVFLVCRGYTTEAKARALDLEKELGVNIIFKVAVR